MSMLSLIMLSVNYVSASTAELVVEDKTQKLFIFWVNAAWLDRPWDWSRDVSSSDHVQMTERWVLRRRSTVHPSPEMSHVQTSYQRRQWEETLRPLNQKWLSYLLRFDGSMCMYTDFSYLIFRESECWHCRSFWSILKWHETKCLFCRWYSDWY